MIDSFGYRPKKLHFFIQAITHSSISKGNHSNERLEFLGDSILDAVLAEYLYHRFPEEDEGFLTKIKSNIVSRKSLSSIASSMEIRKLLKYRKGSDFQLETLEGNALEAIIGAIFLDSDYHTVKKCLHNYVFRHNFSLDKLIHNDHDFKSKLIIWCQKRKMQLEFIIEEEKQTQGKQRFVVKAVANGVVCGIGSDHTKKSAEQQAAKIALEYFNIV